MSGDGNVFIFACCGHYARSLYTYTRSSTGWDQRGEFPDPPAGNDKHRTGFFPGLDRVSTTNNNGHGIYSVTLSDNGLTMAVGVDLGAADVSSDEMSGMHVRVFTWSGTTWDQKGGDIKPESDTDGDGNPSSDGTGESVALSADATVLAVGERARTAGSGRVRVFEYDDTSYGWQLKGDPIEGHRSQGSAGYSVAMNAHGTVVAYGAPWADGVDTWKPDCGSVRVSEWTQTAGGGYAWQQLGADLDGDTYNQQAGWRVALSADGHTVAVAHPKGNQVGFVRVHSLDESREWQPKGADLLGNALGDDTGISLAMSGDGDIVAVGADRYDGEDIPDMGHVRVHGWDGHAWDRVGDDLEGLEKYEYHGVSVGMSSNGHTIAVGVGDSHMMEPPEPRGHIRVYELKDYSPPPLPPAPLGGYAPPPPAPKPLEGGYCLCEANKGGTGVQCTYPVFTTPAQALEWTHPDSHVQSMSYYRARQNWNNRFNFGPASAYASPEFSKIEIPIEHDQEDPCSYEWQGAMDSQGLAYDPPIYDRSEEITVAGFDDLYDTDAKNGCIHCQSGTTTSLNNVGRIKHQSSGMGQDKSFYAPMRLNVTYAHFCERYGCPCQNNELAASSDGVYQNACANTNNWDTDNYEPGPGKYYGETNQLCPQKAIDEGRVLDYRQHVDGRPFTNAIGAQGFGTSTPDDVIVLADGSTVRGKRQYCMTQRALPKTDGSKTDGSTNTEYLGWLEGRQYPSSEVTGRAAVLTRLATLFP